MKPNIGIQMKRVEKVLGAPTVFKVSCNKGNLRIIGLATYDFDDDEDYPDSVDLELPELETKKLLNYLG